MFELELKDLDKKVLNVTIYPMKYYLKDRFILNSY